MASCGCGGALALLCSSCTLILSSLEHRCVGCSDCGGVLAFLLSSLEHRCAGSSDCGGVLEYIELICIKAHLEAHVLELYIPTHLGLEEYTNYSRHYKVLLIL